MYNPTVFKLNNSNDKALDDIINSKGIQIQLATSINQPLFTLGFHPFLHRTKNGMKITKDLESKNKFYYIVNPFEDYIEGSTDDIKSKYLEYFNISNKEPKVVSRAFYKLWEILILFNIANNKNFSYAAVAEAPGSFIQALIKYREKFKLDIKGDKIFSVSIHAEKDNYIKMNKQFLGFYDNKYPELLNIHKTYTTKSSKSYKARDNGDITDIKTISLFKKDITSKKQYVNLVTADGGFEWNDENYQEQEAYMLILGEIIAALNVQAKNGHFVLKIFESFTMVTIKLIYILLLFYEESFIYKPYFSRDSNSEKYLVCKNFKFEQDSTKLKDILQKLEEVLQNMETNKFVRDIFPNLEIPIEFINKIKYINIQIVNTQQIMINKIIKYIKENNYFGEKYHSYKENQIKANKWWVDKFFINEIKDYSTFLEERINFNDSEETLFLNKLIF